jgi:hypothetical protein
MKLWKVLGIAGLAGVAATGVVIAREQRQRAQLTPDEIRDRLHRRLEEAGEEVTTPAPRVSSRRGCLSWGRLRHPAGRVAGRHRGSSADSSR